MSHELQFMEKSHRYKMRTPRGVLAHVPGVTTLIGGGIPKPALYPWYARMVAEFVDQNPLEVERLSLIHISEPTRREWLSRMPSSA